MDFIRPDSARRDPLCNPKPWQLATLVAAFYLAMLCVYLWQHDDGIGRLVTAGSHWVVRGAKVPIPVERKSLGYDGQFYYVLAHDPTGRSQPWIRLDLPHYRQQRILYPLLAYAVSLGGRPHMLPHAMAAIGVVSCWFLAWLAAHWFVRLGHNTWASVCIPLLPGFVFSFFHDLPEPLAAVFLLGAFLAIRSGRNWMATLLLVLGVLTRETLVLAAVCIAVSWSWERFGTHRGVGRGTAAAPRPLAWHIWLLPMLVYAGWQTAVYVRWGHWPAEVRHAVFGWPFAGVIEAARQRLAGKLEWRRDLFDTVFVTLLGITLVLGLCSVRRHGLLAHEKLLFLFQAIMVILYKVTLYSHRGGIMRAAWETQLLGCALVYGSSRRRGILLGAAWTIMGIALALREAVVAR